MGTQSSSVSDRWNGGESGPPSSGDRFSPPEVEETIVIKRFPFLLGRHPECDFALFSRVVSRQHCRFFVRGGNIWVEDLNSYNGTFLNDRAVKEAEPIFDGDQLTIQPYHFLCRVDSDISAGGGLTLIRKDSRDSWDESVTRR